MKKRKGSYPMKYTRTNIKLLSFMIILMGIWLLVSSCKDTKTETETVYVDAAEESAGNGTLQEDTGNGSTPYQEDSNVELTGLNGNHALFSGQLGRPVSAARLGAIDPDPTGLTIITDMDGDGLPDDQEFTTNKYVADYPRIVTRIALPITMEIRVDDTNTANNYTEIVEDNDVNQTINNSMESKHYTQFNLKTTPYVVKESFSESGHHAEEYGHSNSYESSRSDEYNDSVNISIFDVGGGVSKQNAKSSSISKSSASNSRVEDSFERSAMTERTVFEDIGFTDNLDRNGVEFKDETVEEIAQKFRTSQIGKNEVAVGPNAGIVRASLYIKNTSVNIPVRVSNIKVTLSFRTPRGTFLPVKTFTLREEDFSIYNQDIQGGAEFGPYAIEIDNLNTAEVKKALAGGYVPQIHVVSYDLTPVDDSNYTPGVSNLKSVEEAAKGRTAQIMIRGTGMNELYRVAAFDISGSGNYVPGISLKKALFHIFHDPLLDEQWDQVSDPLTVADHDLRWRTGAEEHSFTASLDSQGVDGNSWKHFETYIKTYTDEFNQEHKIETIKRIKNLEKYNPFNLSDNPSYDPNERFSRDDLLKMKYWMILHDGEYFEGDLNDPIWVGDRYEIVLFDAEDFNTHFDSTNYTPLQSQESITLNTRWNDLNNQKEFSRSVYLGKVIGADWIHLEIDLKETRHLFDPATVHSQFGYPYSFWAEEANAWYDFRYTFDPEEDSPQGIPQPFTHQAQGGVNSMIVTINPAQNALEYRITFCLSGCLPADEKVVVISADKLEELNGRVPLTSKTLDSNSQELGTIANGTYQVEVTAYGKVADQETEGQDIEVTTESSSGVLNNVVVTASSGSPVAFSYMLNGYVNQLELRIAESIDAEYYEIKVYGPYNYGFSDPDSPLVFTGHAGQNLIPINSPSQEITDPGLYKVEVTAINQTAQTTGTASSTYVNVDYDRFQSQKIYAPQTSDATEKVNAIDLEINFDDGQGWRRLALSSEDATGQYLDVQNTSYVEHEKQKFHVFLEPPNDVFSGGRQSADVYLRTAADPKYRDTFWMKPLPLVNEIATTLNSAIYLNASATPPENMVQYWTQLAETDASQLETSLACYGHGETWFDFVGNFSFNESIASHLDCEDHSLRFVHQTPLTKDDYFFSPQEERTYEITASLTAEQAVSTSIPSTPTFQVHAYQPNEVLVDNLTSARATGFTVYYREGRAKSVSPDEDLTSAPWTSSILLGVTDTYAVSSLDGDKYYSFVVIASNSIGDSQRSEPVEVRGILTVAWLGPKHFGTNQYDVGNNTGLDSSGNIYIAGVTYGSLGGPNQGISDIFLAKYNTTGVQQWIRQIGTGGEDTSLDVAVDSIGNIYLTGFTHASLGGSHFGYSDIILIKYDVTGTQQWIRQIGTSADETCYEVAVDSTGNIYLIGLTTGSLGGSHRGSHDIILAKYNAAGTLQWIQQLGTVSSDRGQGVAIDSTGNIYIAGYTSDSLGGTHQGGYDIILAKYDAAGNQQWIKQLGSSGNDVPQGIAVDSVGNIYIAGYTEGSLGGAHQGGVYDIFLGKYDASGNQQWLIQKGSGSHEHATGIDLDDSGNIYVTGFTEGDLGRTIQGSKEHFVIKYNSAGTQQWIKQGINGYEWAAGIAVSSSGESFITGDISSSQDSDGDVFLLKYDSEGNSF